MTNLPPGVTDEDTESRGQGWPRCECGSVLNQDEETICKKCEREEDHERE